MHCNPVLKFFLIIPEMVTYSGSFFGMIMECCHCCHHCLSIPLCSSAEGKCTVHTPREILPPSFLPYFSEQSGLEILGVNLDVPFTSHHLISEQVLSYVLPVAYLLCPSLALLIPCLQTRPQRERMHSPVSGDLQPHFRPESTAKTPLPPNSPSCSVLSLLK